MGSRSNRKRKIVAGIVGAKAILIAALIGAGHPPDPVKTAALAARDSIRAVMEATPGLAYARGGDSTAAVSPGEAGAGVWAVVVENQLSGRLFVVGDGDEDGPGGKGKWYDDAWEVNGPQPTSGDDLPTVEIVVVAWVSDLDRFAALESRIAALGQIAWVSGPTPLGRAEIEAEGLDGPWWRLDSWMLAVEAGR